MSTMRAWKRVIDLASKIEEIFFDNGDTLPALFNVDSKDIKEGKKIGEGNWTVHEAEWLGRKVAVKKFVTESTFHNVSLTSREVNHMLGLQHPNVLKLLGFYLTTQKEKVLECTMIMELMDCDLEDYIAREPLSNDQMVYVFAEVARGMHHIHKNGCFHRDLKPKNILVRESIVTGFHIDVKIADFGSSELLGVGDINQTAGTMGYKAPEQFDPVGILDRSKLLPNKVDVFGFGALCFKILTGKKPYESRINVRDVIKKLDRSEISQQNLSKDVIEVIWRCLDENPELRPDFEKISGILDDALSSIREKMPRPLPSSTSTLQLQKSMQKGVQGHDHLESVLGMMELSKKHVIHFIPFNELFVIKLIGQGSYASVYKVEWKGILYAQKIFRGRIGSSSSPVNFYTGGESYFEIISKLSHENIVTFMGYSITPDNRISIILELLDTSLDHIIVHDSRFERDASQTIPKRLKILREIAKGMKYLHDQGVVHGDLTPRNVVVSALYRSDVVVKLIDFGNIPQVRTSRYVAPEILRMKMDPKRTMTIDEAMKSDVYSFGILCQQVLGGSSLEWLNRERVERILMGERPPIPIGTSSKMESLIKSCWNEDVQERPNFSRICENLSKVLYDDSRQGHTYLKCLAQRCCFF